MNPHALAEELVRLSAEYSSMSEEAAAIEQRRPFKWSELRADRRTNTETDNAYDMTEDGQRRIHLKYVMAASEKRMSGIKAALRNAEIEYRHTH